MLRLHQTHVNHIIVEVKVEQDDKSKSLGRRAAPVSHLRRAGVAFICVRGRGAGSRGRGEGFVRLLALIVFGYTMRGLCFLQRVNRLKKLKSSLEVYSFSSICAFQ